MLIARTGSDEISFTQNMTFDEAVSKEGFRIHSELLRALSLYSNYTATSLKYRYTPYIPSKEFCVKFWD